MIVVEVLVEVTVIIVMAVDFRPETVYHLVVAYFVVAVVVAVLKVVTVEEVTVVEVVVA